jgi:ABC-type Fe3+-hydroxamate transport system substrate-binding protein
MDKRLFIDQMHNRVEVIYPPKRIVSLVPSQTELLYDLGLGDEVVGQTLFCVHPSHMQKIKPRVGGTKNFKEDKINALYPDLIIGNKEENEEQGIVSLMAKYPVWMSDIKNLEDALQMIRMVGELVGKQAKAIEISHQISFGFDNLSLQKQGPKVAYFIWHKPWMVAGKDTFINNMLCRLNMQNVFEALPTRYPEVNDEALHAQKPDLVLLSSEPYPFKQLHVEELRKIWPNAKYMFVDGEMFSWYGSRLLKAPNYFTYLLSSM